jgi:hypothetical protein
LEAACEPAAALGFSIGCGDAELLAEIGAGSDILGRMLLVEPEDVTCCCLLELVAAGAGDGAAADANAPSLADDEVERVDGLDCS